MASEMEANAARDQHSEFLRRLGSHAIAVDEVSVKGEKTFAVVAHFAEKPPNVPRSLEIRSGTRTLEVPLVARVTKKFRAE